MELKEVVERCNNILMASGDLNFSGQNKQALQTAISHLETLQKVEEMDEVKKLKGDFRSDRNYDTVYNTGYNDCLALKEAELAGKLEGLEGVISEWLTSSEGKEHLVNKIQELILGKKEE